MKQSYLISSQLRIIRISQTAFKSNIVSIKRISYKKKHKPPKWGIMWQVRVVVDDRSITFVRLADIEQQLRTQNTTTTTADDDFYYLWLTTVLRWHCGLSSLFMLCSVLLFVYLPSLSSITTPQIVIRRWVGTTTQRKQSRGQRRGMVVDIEYQNHAKPRIDECRMYDNAKSRQANIETIIRPIEQIETKNEMRLFWHFYVASLGSLSFCFVDVSFSCHVAFFLLPFCLFRVM